MNIVTVYPTCWNNVSFFASSLGKSCSQCGLLANASHSDELFISKFENNSGNVLCEVEEN